MGVPANPRKAAEYYQKGALLGDVTSMCNLGYCYEVGIGLTIDKAKAAEWYQKAANNGQARGQNNLGFFYQHGSGSARLLVLLFLLRLFLLSSSSENPS